MLLVGGAIGQDPKVEEANPWSSAFQQHPVSNFSLGRSEEYEILSMKLW